jgi:hypothetical protein
VLAILAPLNANKVTSWQLAVQPQITYSEQPAHRKAAAEDTRSQRQKSIDAALEHGASEDADAFRRALRKATAPVTKPKKASRKRKS